MATLPQTTPKATFPPLFVYKESSTPPPKKNNKLTIIFYYYCCCYCCCWWWCKRKARWIEAEDGILVMFLLFFVRDVNEWMNEWMSWWVALGVGVGSGFGLKDRWGILGSKDPNGMFQKLLEGSFGSKFERSWRDPSEDWLLLLKDLL